MELAWGISYISLNLPIHQINSEALTESGSFGGGQRWIISLLTLRQLVLHP